MVRTEKVCIRDVLAIRSPLMNEPLFLAIEDKSKSIKNALLEAVTKLEADGRQQQALGLEQMLNDHKVVVGGVVWDPELGLSSLTFSERSIDGTIVNVADISLMRRYVGGKV